MPETKIVEAKAFRVTESTRPILQMFIANEIPEETKFVLASPEGFTFFNDEPSPWEDGRIRIPRMSILSYYEISYEHPIED